MRAIRINIAGSKGGSGKSTLSHALALGASLLGERSMVVTTDDREICFDRKAYPNPESKLRPYVMFDGRTAADLKKILTAAVPVHRIIDGGADRDDLDGACGMHCDLTIITIKRGRTDTQIGVRSHARMTRDYPKGAPIVLLPVFFSSRATDKVDLELTGDIEILPFQLPEKKAMECLDQDNTPYLRDIPYEVKQTCKEMWIELKAYCEKNNIGTGEPK